VALPFDAVLVIAFGGPQGRADIRPFLANVLRGRRVAPERVEEVAHHYELFDGVSPITELTNKQAAGLRERLAMRGTPLPVYVGMRNWHPYLADTLARMSREGVRRTIGVIAAAHRSYSGCLQYKENVRDARVQLRGAQLADVDVTYVGDWHVHPGFVAANASNIRAALDRLPASLRGTARLIFTAHSIPVAMAERYPYRQQFEATAALVAREVHADRGDWATVYQSRSGRPGDPWLEPDVCDYLRRARGEGVQAAVIAPIGFVADHVEVLYDLDVEAAQVCREVGITMERAQAANDHPRFLDTMADVVLDTVEKYGRGRPLALAT
jgi:protoporphyrin/coproporphyrin ferrochelatase